jgi:hypothetical protein
MRKITMQWMRKEKFMRGLLSRLKNINRVAGNPAVVQLTVKKNSLLPFYPEQFLACLGGCDPTLLGRT